ncbi:MAG: hypothetical protein L0H41_06700 [Microlunatus sp.]|nr:hypothetical protein [Microlunatus sp.]MDN5771321.1 hypothetical protein [Microlunatus sp.]MDN5803937.1 hypothetical protein [Microlunatus sp.]
MTSTDIPWRHRLQQGLHASVRGNAQAFGFSVTVTVTFGIVSQLEPNPRIIDLVLFALAAVAAFSLLNVVVVLQMGGRYRDAISEQATLIGTATDFLAVGAAVGAAIGIGTAFQGTWAWLLAPFAAGVLYVVVQAVELAVGRKETDGNDDADNGDQG